MTTPITHLGREALRACGSLALALVLALLVLPISAQAQSQACYLVADNVFQGQGDEEGGHDALGVLLGGTASPIGLTNTERIEAIAYDSQNDVLYATDEVPGTDGVFGSLDTTTGTFTSIGVVGCGDGANGTVCFDDIDGLSFDPASGVLYGSVRLKGDGVKDVLIQIDTATGAFVPDAFGAGVDYVVIEAARPVPLDDIDDIAFDAEGTLYGILNEGSAGFMDRLVTIDPMTGQLLSAVPISVGGQMQRDIEGLTFDADGRLLGVQGGAFQNVFVIDPATGDATLLVNITQATDYEAIDCVVERPPMGDCVECGTDTPGAESADKVSELTLRYGGDTAALVEVYNDKDNDHPKDLLFSGTLQPGETFTIRASDIGEDRFNNEIGFFVDGVKNAEIHASCSQPLGPGTTEGLFTVTAGKDQQGRELCPDEPSMECDCEGGVTQLTMRYDGDTAATVTVYNDKNADPDKILFSAQVQPGETFSFSASTLDEDKFKSNISFYVDGDKSAELHTSCSQPIGPGKVAGQFTVVSGIDREGNMLCPVNDPPGGDCDCDGGVTRLTMRYDGDGPAWVTVYNDKNADPDKVLFDAQVQPGEEFSFAASALGEDKFKSNISFYIEHDKQGELHTSCSQPIGPGKTVGPFTVVSGIDRRGNMLCPLDPSSACDCEGGVKQLTMRYDGDHPVWVTVYNDKNADPDKVLFDAQVQPGEEFSFAASALDEDKFKSNISFYIDDHKNAVLHTSCSRPIGEGQVVGAFTLISGIDRNDNALCPFEDDCDDDDLDGDDDCDDGDDAASRGVPTEFEVAQAYPNPFSRQTTIGFALPETAQVQVTVYDVRGRQVAVLLDEERVAGRHQVAFDASQLAPGMYVYRVATPLGTQTGKVVLMK